MPINNYLNRQECTMYPGGIKKGYWVKIITKEKQGSSDEKDLVFGEVKRVLSKGGFYRNGVKVELTNGVIGRVQYLVARE